MATFPEELYECIEADNYEGEEGYPVIRSEMDAGPPKRRRRFTAAVRPRRFSLLMDETQREVFRNFYREDCFQGAGDFTMRDPEFAAATTIRLGFVSGPRYVIVEKGLYWRYFLDLEEIPS